MAKRIDANHMLSVKHFPVLLRRMPDDRNLAILVPRRDVKMQMLPKQQIVRLLIERNICGIVRMYEKVRRDLEMAPSAADKRQMLWRHIVQLPLVDPHLYLATYLQHGTE